MAQDKVKVIEEEMLQMKKQMGEEKRKYEEKLDAEKNHFIKRINDLKPPKWYSGVLQSILAAFIVLFLYIIAVVHFNLFGLNEGVEKRAVDKSTQEIQTQHPHK